MNKFVSFAAIAAFSVAAVPAFAEESAQPVQAAADSVAAATSVRSGKMLYSASGQRIASI